MPGFGTAGGKFQISTGWHSAWAHRDYFDSRYNRTFTNNWRPYERVSITDVSGRWNVNQRFSVTATLPIVFNHFSLLLPPVNHPKGKRYGWGANGLGDLTLSTQTWILKPQTHPYGNFALVLGMKVPTGNWDVRKWMPDETGKNFAKRAIYPPAVMPGDGGVGAIIGFNAYKTFTRKPWMKTFTFFASGQYLFNPRNTNGTPSMVASLGTPAPPGSPLVNSVTDSFSWEAGFSAKVPKTWQYENLKGMRLRLVTGMEGLPSRDLIGRSDGLRQPAYSINIGPGFSYQRKRDFFIVEVPFIIGRHVNPGKTALPGVPTVGANGQVIPAAFNPARQMGLIPPLTLSMRYVRSL